MLDFDCGKNAAEFVDNNNWLQQFSLIDFLREVGRFFNVSYMISKDSVKQRLANGLSFTEFTYQLFQAYDFFWLYQHKNCKLQMGGSDQWGNITGGCELIQKKLNKSAFALTTDLLTKSDRSKFGKSEEGNIWLDPDLTSPYKFYQFWLNVEDSQIGKLLRIFTFLPK
ncbi:MAG: tyrosine--tRNA ligase [Bacteroidales bacterium]|nr:tyrosine--tRNA ligase [Bacteroidales bacterium]